MKRRHTNWSDNSKHSLWLIRRNKLQINRRLFGWVISFCSLLDHDPDFSPQIPIFCWSDPDFSFQLSGRSGIYSRLRVCMALPGQHQESLCLAIKYMLFWWIYRGGPAGRGGPPPRGGPRGGPAAGRGGPGGPASRGGPAARGAPAAARGGRAPAPAPSYDAYGTQVCSLYRGFSLRLPIQTGLRGENLAMNWSLNLFLQTGVYFQTFLCSFNYFTPLFLAT